MKRASRMTPARLTLPPTQAMPPVLASSFAKIAWDLRGPGAKIVS